MRLSILIVDDEPAFRSALVELLADAGWPATGVGSGEEALAAFQSRRYEIVFSDLRMPGIDGLTLLREIKAKHPETEVVMITSHTSIDSAIEALRLGAYDYLIKPLESIDQVLAIIRRASEKLALAGERNRLLEDLRTKNRELEESQRALQESYRIIAQYSEDLSALYAAEKEILAGLDLSEVYRRSVDRLSRLVGMRPAVLWVVSDSGRELLLQAQSGWKEQDIAGAALPLSAPLDAPTSEILPPLAEALASRLGAPSLLLHPVSGRRRLFGVLGIVDSTGEALSERERDLLFRFCISVGLAIENARLYEKVKALAICDGLTGLYNRRRFEEALAAEVTRSLRYKHPVSLIFIDIDSFKQYNDSHGHLLGDALLKEAAELVQKQVRSTDIVCRYGGEEFTIILPSTDKEGAMRIAEEIRSKIQAHPFPYREMQPGGAVTVSLGVAASPADGLSPGELVKAADKALYRAKRGGRNRVCEATLCP